MKCLGKTLGLYFLIIVKGDFAFLSAGKGFGDVLKESSKVNNCRFFLISSSGSLSARWANKWRWQVHDQKGSRRLGAGKGGGTFDFSSGNCCRRKDTLFLSSVGVEADRTSTTVNFSLSKSSQAS